MFKMALAPSWRALFLHPLNGFFATLPSNSVPAAQFAAEHVSTLARSRPACLLRTVEPLHQPQMFDDAVFGQGF